ncbi:MAG: RecX family transcriptional regulator [Flavonifractor plautii]
MVRHYGAMGCGAARVRQELHRRGVPKELWDEALKQLPPPQEAIEKFLCAKLRGRPLTPRTAAAWPPPSSAAAFVAGHLAPSSTGWGKEIDET